jgi:RimJ/RimL family protein N-acetyltransferase
MDSMDGAIDYGTSLLAGTKIQLRETQETDVARLAHWWNQPGTAIFQAESVKPRSTATIEQMFRDWSGNGVDGAAAFSVVAKDSDELVGHVSMWGANVAVRCAELAIIIGDEHAGQGYGTDAVRVMTRYGFDELGLNRVELRTWSFNTRAIASYRKAGFVEEGRRRQVVFHQGRFYDQVFMGLLADEWREAAA